MAFVNYIKILSGLLIIVLGAIVLPRIEVNNDIKSTFTEESFEQKEFNSLNDKFKQQEEPLIISIEKKGGYKKYSDWSRVNQLVIDLKEHFESDSIVSVFDVQTLKRVGLNVFKKPLINIKGEEMYEGWDKRLESYDYVSSSFVSKDFTQVNIYFYPESWSIEKEEQLSFFLNKKNKSEAFDRYTLLSEPIINNYVKEKVTEDLYSLALFGFILILISFYFFFRSFKIIILIGVISAINVNATLLLMYFSGLEFNILTSIVPTIISILSVTDLNHIVYEAADSDQNFVSDRTPIFNALFKLRKTLVATSVTTAIGFAIFLFNDVSSVRVFSLISILGIFISLINVFIFAPTFYSLLNPKQARVFSFNKISSLLSTLVSNNYRAISIGFMIVLLLISAITSKYVSVDYNNRANLNKSSDLYNGIMEFDSSFKMTKTIEAIVSFPNNSDVIDILQELELIELKIKSEISEASVLSIVGVVKEYNRIANKGLEESYILPNHLGSSLIRFISEDQMITPYFHEETNRHFKLIVKTPNHDARYSQEKIKIIQEGLLNSTSIEFCVGGADFYEDKSALSLVYSVLSGLFISIFVISLLTVIYFRNLGYFLPTLLVNLFPIVGSLLLVTLFYGKITPSIVIILSISFGIALDDTMYFVSKLKRIEGTTDRKIVKTALIENISSNAFPMISTSLTLSCSFLSLLFSNFEINVINSVILVVTLIIALVSDLLILPSLILFFHKKKTNIDCELK